VRVMVPTTHWFRCHNTYSMGRLLATARGSILLLYIPPSEDLLVGDHISPVGDDCPVGRIAMAIRQVGRLSPLRGLARRSLAPKPKRVREVGGAFS
jgi:hypothetical protein